jgi:hypothetical protein
MLGVSPSASCFEVVCVYGAREGMRGGGYTCLCSSQPPSHRTDGIVWPVYHIGQACRPETEFHCVALLLTSQEKPSRLPNSRQQKGVIYA